MQKKLSAQLHRPQQQRSIASQQRMVDAAKLLIEEMPWENISIADIAREAKTSVGGFYARFASKDALLLLLHQQYETHRTDYFEAFFDSDIWSKPLPHRVSELVETVIHLMDAHKGLLRTFLLRYWSRPEEFNGAFGERLESIYADAKRLLLVNPEEISHPDPEVAVAMAVAIMSASCREVLVLKPAPSPGAIRQNLSSFKNELTGMVCNYLGAKTESQDKI